MHEYPAYQKPLALWGGVEGTVNRVGDAFFDQNERSGHAQRPADLDLIAGLGIEALRYPILWERTAPDGLDRADWSWPDGRLGRLRELGIRPIVGLLHHGNGPRQTSLLDPQFPDKFAAYARAVAQRYPWVAEYTPVNEPMTTARFCGLYGHWYPHKSDRQTFLRILLGQCRATVLAMRAIREVNPEAQLVQTDDLGKTHSTPALAPQAALDNERRWLTFDLLCGRVDRAHPLWDYFLEAGIPESEILWLRENPCPPDVVGVDYYITSERFLDERLENYPEWSHGGSARQPHADVEAVRVREAGIDGIGVLLRDAWERYGLPLAVTEVHLACTREEQMRWLREVWETTRRVRRDGIDVRAVTPWALFGAFDWCHLVKHEWGDYEPGAYDLRAPRPRPTALAAMIRDLAAGRVPSHPVLAVPGWWHRPERIEYPPAPRPQSAGPPPADVARGKSVAPLLIVGAAGRLGSACARLCAVRGLAHSLPDSNDLDPDDPEAVAAALRQYEPWAVVDTRGFEDGGGPSYRPAVLARACAQRGVSFLLFSSDAVFDGARETPYTEDDAVTPQSMWGRKLAAGEAAVRESSPTALIVRTGVCFEPWHENDWVTQSLRALATGETLAVDDRRMISPTYLPDLVQASLDLLLDGEQGVWHLTNPGAMTEEEFVRLAATAAGLDVSRLTSHSGPDSSRLCHRVLGSVRGTPLPPLLKSLADYLRHRSYAPGA